MPYIPRFFLIAVCSHGLAFTAAAAGALVYMLPVASAADNVRAIPHLSSFLHPRFFLMAFCIHVLAFTAAAACVLVHMLPVASCADNVGTIPRLSSFLHPRFFLIAVCLHRVVFTAATARMRCPTPSFATRHLRRRKPLRSHALINFDAVDHEPIELLSQSSLSQHGPGLYRKSIQKTIKKSIFLSLKIESKSVPKAIFKSNKK